MTDYFYLLLGVVSLFQVLLAQTQIDVPRNTVYAAEGGNVTLSVRNLTAMYMMSWTSPKSEQIITFIDGKVLTKPQTNYSGRITLIPDNGSLIITSVLKSDGGNYTISMEPVTPGGPINQMIIRLIVFELNVTVIPAKIVEGNTANISCIVRENTALEKIWKKDGIILASNSHIRIIEASVIITSASRDDMGNYSCTVQNQDGQGISQAAVNVYYGPDSPVILKSQTKDCVSGDVLSSTAVYMSCTSASNPPSSIYWLLNQKYFTSNHSISISSASSNNTGTYTCVANNSVTNQNSTTAANLNVVDYCLSGGAVAGIVIGCVAFLLLLILLITLLVKWRRRRKQGSSSKSALSQYPRATLQEPRSNSREQPSVSPNSATVPWYTTSSGGGRTLTIPETPETATDEWNQSLYKAFTDKDGKFSTAV
ncbi:carcinoembryonic antigen-related cell adhesion molecule 2-like [Protopterus annectens]|uniref:carcinoembryonic antigen-related cell adhesion molecule 2-like n=1 Tax=Protopterus annectens TaxID=7888 RepID=UPI001CF95C94|nr:carcinoembryonic antigen-related cell adhesion molecule 2-like [Protopterus annectens]